VDVKNKYREIQHLLFRAHIMIPLPDLAFYLGRLFAFNIYLLFYFFHSGAAPLSGCWLMVWRYIPWWSWAAVLHPEESVG
jgi:hypothetical protein